MRLTTLRVIINKKYPIQYEAQLADELGAVCVDDLRELVRDPGLMAELGMPPLHEAQLAARLAEQC